MYKKTIVYEDFNGVERKEDFYFNLNKAEIMQTTFGYAGDIVEFLQKIIDTKDKPKLAEMFKELILKSYGEKSDDGKRFIKTGPDGRPLSEKFEETIAFSDLYMELATNDKAAAEFVNGIIPKDIAAKMAEEAARLEQFN